MVSVILPTRGRFEMFKKSIVSLISHSSDVKNFEVLVALDNDDIDSNTKIVDFISDKTNIKIFYYDRQYYSGLNNYYNDLSLKSSGTSILLWNDDAIMESFNWDIIILDNHKDFCVLSPKVSNMEDYWLTKGVLFPVIPKKWVDLTGEWSYLQACDSWIDILSKRLGLLKNVGSISIKHNRHDLTNENLDNTYMEGRKHVGVSKDNWSVVIDEHYEKLNNYLKSINQNFVSTWGINPNYEK